MARPIRLHWCPVHSSLPRHRLSLSPECSVHALCVSGRLRRTKHVLGYDCPCCHVTWVTSKLGQMRVDVYPSLFEWFDPPPPPPPAPPCRRYFSARVCRLIDFVHTSLFGVIWAWFDVSRSNPLLFHSRAMGTEFVLRVPRGGVCLGWNRGLRQ